MRGEVLSGTGQIRPQEYLRHLRMNLLFANVPTHRFIEMGHPLRQLRRRGIGGSDQGGQEEGLRLIEAMRIFPEETPRGGRDPLKFSSECDEVKVGFKYFCL